MWVTEPSLSLLRRHLLPGGEPADGRLCSQRPDNPPRKEPPEWPGSEVRRARPPGPPGLQRPVRAHAARHGGCPHQQQDPQYGECKDCMCLNLVKNAPAMAQMRLHPFIVWRAGIRYFAQKIQKGECILSNNRNHTVLSVEMRILGTIGGQKETVKAPGHAGYDSRPRGVPPRNP